MRRWIAALLAAIPLVASAQLSDTLFSSPSVGGGGGEPISATFETTSLYWMVADLNAAAPSLEEFGIEFTGVGGARTSVALTPTAYGQFIRVANAVAAANQWNGGIQTNSAGAPMTAGAFTRSLGFAVSIKWGFPFAKGPLNRFIAGAIRGNQVMVGTDEPSAYLDTVYVGYDSIVAGDALQVCSNDAVGSATCVDVGPINSAEDPGIFLAEFACAPGCASISYRVRQLDGTLDVAGSLSSDLPTSTQPLRVVSVSNRGGAVSNGEMDLIHLMFEVPY